MIEPHLDVDNLMSLMPDSVREEYKVHGDACIFGFTPGVKHWLETSQHPRLIRWREDMKRAARTQWATAIVEQKRMAEAASEMYANSTRRSIRVQAVIHPVIKSWMETEHGPHVWKDRSALADTKRHDPRLFVNT